MFNLFIKNTGGHIGVMTEMTEGFFLFLSLETNDNYAKFKLQNGVLELIIRQSLRAISDFVNLEEYPSILADRIDETLVELAHRGLGPETVQYTGVVYIDNNLFICKAGGCRVHLIEGDTLKGITRDHNIISDISDDFPIDFSESNQISRGSLLNTVTRALGVHKSESPPEKFHWECVNPSKIVICSSEIHKFGKPSSYLPLCFGSERAILFNEVKSGGMLAVFEKE